MSKKHTHNVIPVPLLIATSPGSLQLTEMPTSRQQKRVRFRKLSIWRSNGWSHFSSGFKYQYHQIFFWLEDEQVHMRFSKMYTYTNDCEFPLIATAVPILQPMVPCRGYSLFTSVMLKCQLFYKQSRPSKIKGILGSYKIYHVDKGMGLVTSVACREVIEYHTINPNHFSFQRH